MQKVRTPRVWFLLAGGMALVLLIGLAPSQPAAAMPAPPDPATAQSAPSPAQQERQARAVPAKPKPRPADPAARHVAATPPAVSWPAAGTARVEPAANTRPRATGAAPAAVRAGGLPISVAADKPVDVRVFDQPTATASRVRGVLFQLSSTGQAGLSFDYSAFRYAYGGDWAARLRVVQLPACALTSPAKPECQRETPVPSKNNVKAGTVAAQASPQASVYALTAAPEGSTGDYKASKLSIAGSWDTSTQSGDFSYTYPIAMPPVPGGLQPNIDLSYSSNAVDGHIAAANNQPSSVGDGWTLPTGSVDRKYKSCATDDIPLLSRTGDQCWGGENATVTIGGTTTELILNGNSGNTWRSKNDDGTKVEHLFDTGHNDAGTDLPGDDNGEYWKITKPDGTQYFFGLNHVPGWSNVSQSTNSVWTVPVFGRNSTDPCHGTTFATSWCQQAYKWNLDYVVDPDGNAVTFFYQRETNSYGLNMGKTTTKYTRGGYPVRAEYGTRDGSALTGSAPARVLFAPADRCIPGKDCGKHVADSYPDVPWDQDCSASCTNQISPTFWSSQRLWTITTQVQVNGSYQDVDRWTLDQKYLDPGDGTGLYLWLHGITHTGLVGGTTALPEMTFDGTAYANRVDSPLDGSPPMDKYRITAINLESGGRVSVSYNGADCDKAALPVPDSNTTRCFPVRWSPKESGPIDDWFTRYVVNTVIQNDDAIGGSAEQTTTYLYPAKTAAWAYNDDPLIEAKHRSWTSWRGYQKVTMLVGDPVNDPTHQLQTDHLFYRGMNGDHLANGQPRPATVTDFDNTTVTPDDEALAGFERESVTRNGKDGPVITDTVVDAWQHGPTATQGTHRAFLARPLKSTTRTQLPGSAWRTTQTVNSYDDYGNATVVDDFGDTSTALDDKCVRTDYVSNTALGMLDKPSRIETVGNNCAGPRGTPTNLISDVRNYYDGHAIDAAPGRGLLTKTEQATSFSGQTPVYSQVKRSSYDDYGRVENLFNERDKKTTTSYTDVRGLNTSFTTTGPLGLSTVSTVDVRRGSLVDISDVNALHTSMTYDALGRLAQVWKPGRSQANNDGPNTRYTYTVRNDAPSVIQTDELKANANYVSSFSLSDGFLRDRQTQSPAFGGGIVVTDKFYDSRGLVTKSNDKLTVAGTPGATLLLTNDNAVAAQTRTDYDGAGRATLSSLWSRNVKQSQTRTDYYGDHTDVTPPQGGTATGTYADARGQTTELRQYHAPTPTGAHDSITSTYTPAGKLATYTDADGNISRFSYNLHGDQTVQETPDRGKVTTTYDATGQPLTMQDARSVVTAFVYDDMERKIEERQNSATGPLLASWTYDTMSNGQLTGSTRFVGTDAYTTAVTAVDAFKRPTDLTVTIPAVNKDLAGSYTTTTSYLADGTTSSVDYPKLGQLSAEHVDYTYNSLGLPSTTTSSMANYVTSTLYTAFLEPSQIQFDDRSAYSLWHTLYYDEATRKLSGSLVEKNSVGGVVVENTSYQYDPAGNVTSADDRLGGSTVHDVQCYSYDYQQRMTEAWAQANACASTPSASVLGGPAPYWQSYGYGNSGNRLTKTQHGVSGGTDSKVTSSYPAPGSAQPHALQTTTATGQASQRYDYDTAGNVTKRPTAAGTQTLDWDGEQHLDSVTGGGANSSYVYDADGALLTSSDNTGSTLYLGNGELHVDKAGKKTASRYYTHGADTIAVRTTAGLSYLFTDRNGTPDLSVNAVTLKPTKRRYDAFGVPRDNPLAAWPDDRGFVNGTVDSSTGLSRLGMRNYDPDTGRFESVDPVMDPKKPQQNNGYSYGWNSPASAPDRTGAAPQVCDRTGLCWTPDPPPAQTCDRTGLCWTPDPKPESVCDRTGACWNTGRTVKPPSKPGPAKKDQQEHNDIISKLLNKIGVPDEMAERIKALLNATMPKEASICLSGVAGLVVEAGVEGCLNFDAIGVTANFSIRAGFTLGGGASGNIIIRFSSQSAVSAGQGTSYGAETGGVATPVGGGGIGGGAAYYPGYYADNGGTSSLARNFELQYSWGLRASFGSAYVQKSYGTDYLKWSDIAAYGQKVASNFSQERCYCMGAGG